MTDTAFCGDCGARIPATAKFCVECGARQEPVAGAVPPTTGEAPQPDLGAQARAVAQQAAERVEQLNPGAGELAGQLASQLRTPGVLAAVVVGVAGLVGALVVGLAIALLAIGDSSAIGFSGDPIGIVKETLLHATQAVGAAITISGEEFNYTVLSTPLLATVLVVAVIAGAAYLQARRLTAMAPLARIAWCVAGAVPFALLMLIVAVAARADVEGAALRASAGSVFGLSLLWGALGGAIGSVLAVRRSTPEQAGGILPAAVRPFAAVAAAVLRPLGFVLIIAAVAATIVVGVQTARNAGDVVGARSTVGAVIENSTFAVEHGVHAIALGTFARFEDEEFRSAGSMPIPVTKVDRISSRDGYRLFDFSDGMPALVFIPGMLLLIGLPVLGALYAGFAAARAAGARSALQGALWGAAVGPVWAITLALLNTLVSKTPEYPLFGRADGGSVFGFMLLFGLVIGAFGGALAAQAQRAPVAPVEPGPSGAAA
jgi:zinc-ribbon domain